MRALYLLLFLTTASFGVISAQSQGCSDLFFSEYVEGSSGSNKCVEIYNPTGSAINLATLPYKVQVYPNGAVSPNSTINLTGSVAAYGTYVLCNSSANADLLNVANQTSGSLSHNGNDALVLVKTSDNIPVDIFGNIGDNPGTAWTSGALSTADQVLRRKSTVQAGITTDPIGTGVSSFTTLGTEWDNFSDTDYSGFGTHTSTCVPETSCSITNINVSIGSCHDNGTPLNASDDYVDVSVCVNYSNRPSTGNLVISGDVNASVAAGSIGTAGHCDLSLTTPADGTPIIVTATFDADPACTMTVSNVSAPMPCSVVPNCALPFFSEYIEGSGNNKCLEIYNPTASPIDLAAGGYKVEMYFNGSSGVGTTVNLAGVIQPGDVYVVCNSGAGLADFLPQADQISGGGWYNGDDAVALVSNDGVLDVIGQIGVDPGTNWSTFGIETSEQTLRRFSFIQKGDNNGSDAFNPASQWETYEQNTFWGLGYHKTSCQPALPSGWNPFNIGCPGGTVGYNGGQWTLSSNCYEDLSSGVDEQTLVFQEFCGDGEIIARSCGINGLGFAGLTFRESASANSKQVSLLFQNSQNAHWFTRSATGAAMQFQSKPRLNRTWMRIIRIGNVFRGYISTNGSAWQLLFQSQIDMDECMLVGLITESNVDGANTTANFCNVNLIGYEGEGLSRPLHDGSTPINEHLSPVAGSVNEMPEGADLFDSNNNGSELSIRPNPVVNELEVVIPSTIQAGAILQIMDLNGKKLFSERIGEGSNLMRLNLSELNLSGGVYLLSIQDGATLLTKRFVKVN